jgi:hypothetical protein
MIAALCLQSVRRATVKRQRQGGEKHGGTRECAAAEYTSCMVLTARLLRRIQANHEAMRPIDSVRKKGCLIALSVFARCVTPAAQIVQ